MRFVVTAMGQGRASFNIIPTGRGRGSGLGSGVGAGPTCLVARFTRQVRRFSLVSFREEAGRVNHLGTPKTTLRADHARAFCLAPEAKPRQPEPESRPTFLLHAH